MENIRSTPPKPSYVVETITMTTVTEHRIVHEATDIDVKTRPSQNADAPLSSVESQGNKDFGVTEHDESCTTKPNINSNTSINGILKGGKFRKTEPTQVKYQI